LFNGLGPESLRSFIITHERLGNFISTTVDTKLQPDPSEIGVFEMRLQILQKYPRKKYKSNWVPHLLHPF
jgi:hypothetical protein